MSGRFLWLATGALAVLGLVVLAMTWTSAPTGPTTDAPPLWSMDPDAVQAIAVTLPRSGLAAEWTRQPDGAWRFADPAASPVDQERWAGIPMLVSSLRPDRQIVSDAAATALSVYGLDVPRVVVEVRGAQGRRVVSEIGDESPSGTGDYVRLVGSPDVYLVSPAWRDVLERLVMDPPYQAGSEPAIAPQTD